MSRIGIVALGRPTFDVPFAEDRTAACVDLVASLGHEIVAPTELQLDAAGVAAAARAVQAADPDRVIILMSTFTDGTMPLAAAGEVTAPLVLWGIPEERTGDRLRLNSLCGINLAAYAFVTRQIAFDYLYVEPNAPEARSRIEAALSSMTPPHDVVAEVPLFPDNPAAQDGAAAITDRLAETRLAVFGDHPDGFDPCAYDVDALASLGGVTIDAVPLPTLFATAEALPAEVVEPLRRRAERDLGNLAVLDADGTDHTLRLNAAIGQMAAESGWNGVATRCWPECFTEFGGAACAAMGMLNVDGVPGCCEADVYGALTSLVLQWVSGEPAFIADLVDLVEDGNTGAFWHCGLAPLTMADPEGAPQGTIHPNRKMPLLHEFALKPGRVTIARIGAAPEGMRMSLGTGEMIRTSRPYAGTAGVVRLDRPVGEILETVMRAGLDHHYGIAYGDHRDTLTALAARLELPIVQI